MSSAAQAAALKAQAALLHELETAITAFTATRYLSVAGLVVLLYDHILLFGEEKRLVWSAKASWSKSLFLVNRYVVPFCLIITTHELSGISTAGLSTTFCQTWLSMISFLCVVTLAVANVFVVHRVYALWGRNRRILKILVATFSIIYLAAVVATGFAAGAMFPHLSYSPVVRSCVLDRAIRPLVIPYALPIVFDIFLFLLMCWNAFDRPRSMQTTIVKQLYLDGVVYFGVLLTLRIFNILVVAFANVAYVQLGVFFIWSMIPALINRMLITISSAVEDTRLYDPAGRETPFEHIEPPFDLEPSERSFAEYNGSMDFIDLSYGGKEVAPRLPVIERGHSFQMQV